MTGLEESRLTVQVADVAIHDSTESEVAIISNWNDENVRPPSTPANPVRSNALGIFLFKRRIIRSFLSRIASGSPM